METSLKIAFFGTPEIAVTVLKELKKAGLTPDLAITAPDKPKGRKLILTAPPVKIWAQENGIKVIQPEKLDEDVLNILHTGNFNLFIVASYGKILKKELLDIPKYGSLNVHPSLLPRLRGASPIKSAILKDEKKTGVTIMLVDEEVDHGPIIAQASVEPSPWPPKASVLEEILAKEGGKLLVETIPKWASGEITPEKQDESKATYTRKIEKEDGLIELDADPYENLRKIRAFDEWPGAYFFVERNGKQIRVKITNADFKDGVLKISKVIPEGKKEMNYEDFLRAN